MWRKQSPLYFAYRNEVGNGHYEGLISSVYQKLKCTHFLISYRSYSTDTLTLLHKATYIIIFIIKLFVIVKDQKQLNAQQPGVVK